MSLFMLKDLSTAPKLRIERPFWAKTWALRSGIIFFKNPQLNARPTEIKLGLL